MCGGGNKYVVRRKRDSVSGFTLIELIVAIVILGIVTSVALPRFVNLGREARIAAIQGLAGAVRSSVGLIKSLTAVRGIGVAGAQVNITWINIDLNTPVRLWSGYPDRWCDGIGMTMQGAAVPGGGCYLSTAPVTNNGFTFYGYGNSMIPAGDAGWRIENATDPLNCSVGYNYNGTGTPLVRVYTAGC